MQFIDEKIIKFLVHYCNLLAWRLIQFSLKLLPITLMIIAEKNAIK